MLGTRPPRHVCHLTEAGGAEFWRWLDEPVRRNREVRGDFLLKLFFPECVRAHDALRLVSRQIAIARENLAAQERNLERYARGSARIPTMSTT
jgi:DNA-binding PadR family transcriptional regulator